MDEKIKQFFALQVERGRRYWKRLRSYARSVGMFAVGVLAALAALLLYNIFTPDPPQLTTQDVNDSIVQVLASATPPPAYSTLVYQVIRPSLVFIETEATDDDTGEIGNGLGSGIVVNDSGNILTSLHVVADASDIHVIFADGTKSKAQVVVAQPENDIALLSANQLPAEIIPATLGNPNAMRVGDEAFVVGHPLGLFGSMSAGVISGFNRSFRPVDGDQKLEGLIQIDAAVNPGNSGGPLLNRYGQVVGIVTALANPTEEDFFIGIGFAVPINVAGGGVGLPPY